VGRLMKEEERRTGPVSQALNSAEEKKGPSVSKEVRGETQWTPMAPKTPSYQFDVALIVPPCAANLTPEEPKTDDRRS
jgi:hypothetical protein